MFALVLPAGPAQGYSVSTFVTQDCHERLTLAALRGFRARLPNRAPPLPVGPGDAPVVKDLPFDLDGDAGDLAAAALVVGVRDNDLKGRRSTDLDALALIHGDPATQHEHCLRALEDLEPTGTTDAVSRCREYILARVGEALDHLGPDGLPDADARVALRVALAIRGGVTVRLPGFYIRLGQAMHALQDGFSHSYRTPDGGAITAALTWLHPVGDELDESQAGPPHSAALDRCTSLDAFRTTRLALAEEASQALMEAAAGPGERAERLAAAAAAVDKYLRVQLGCGPGNAWCNAREHGAYPNETSACSVAGQSGADYLGIALLVLAMATAIMRRRKVAVVLAVTFLFAFPAAAAEVPSRVTAAPPEARFVDRSRFGGWVALGASLDHTAMSAAAGIRFRLTPRWLVGLDAEWNPWISLEGERVRPGAFNAYATVVRRWSMLSEDFDIRTSAHLGTSTVLFDLYGVPMGSTGLYTGVSLLGLEWRASRMLSVVIDPADVAFPMPQLRGAPFGYLQYRLTIGLQWGA